MTDQLDAEFKTLLIRVLTGMVECSENMKEEVKATLSEIKTIHREPTVKGRKLGFRSTIWNIRKK